MKFCTVLLTTLLFFFQLAVSCQAWFWEPICYPSGPGTTSEAAMKIMKRPPQWLTMEAGGWSWRSDHDHASLALQRRSGGQARVWRTLLQNCTVHIPHLHCWDRDGRWYRVSLRTFVADCFFQKWKYQNQWYSIINTGTGRLFDHIFAIIIAAAVSHWLVYSWIIYRKHCIIKHSPVFSLEMSTKFRKVVTIFRLEKALIGPSPCFPC